MKKFLDIICFVIGPFLTVYFLFDFGSSGSPRRYGGGGYYYSVDSQIGLAIGITLICIGFLRKYWRKNTSPSKQIETEEKKPKEEKKESKKGTITFY